MTQKIKKEDTKNLTVYDKKLVDYTEKELVDLTETVFRYLKFDSEMDELSENKRSLKLTTGQTIQYVYYHEMGIIEEIPYGFTDEIVYVSRDTEGNKNGFMGMHWKQSIDARINLVKKLTDEDAQGVMFAILMHDGQGKSKTF